MIPPFVTESPPPVSAKSRLLRSALDVLHHTRAFRLLERRAGGLGVIFTLHHVRPPAHGAGDFAPNRILEISPQFLELTLRHVTTAGFDAISLGEARRRLLAGRSERRFVCFTLDDGYADNYVHAYPLFARYGVPFTVYVTSGLPDAGAVLWWRHLEDIVRANREVAFPFPAGERRFAAGSTRQKYRAFNAIYWALRALPHAQQVASFERFAAAYGADPGELCRRESMTWEMIGALAASDIAEIGAHTRSHFALGKLPAALARREIEDGRQAIAARTGRQPVHFAYPYGDPGSAGEREYALAESLGFETAVTTRKGMLFPRHGAHLHALPRVSLNGDYQAERYLRLFLSGAPFALWNGLRREPAPGY